MDQSTRNKLRNTVTQCRKLLEDATIQALQGRFGIYASNNKGEVKIEDENRMAHLTEEDRACRQDLIDHLEHIKAICYKPCEALDQLIREIAFTHLNRLCAYKMMEARGLIREAVSKGLKSQYFFFYLADHPEDERLHSSGLQEVAYRNFLDWLGSTLSEEIGILFSPNDPANRIYPPQRVLDEVLVLINDMELKDIWSQDETIGWVYQYFTPKEMRDRARKDSPAPRNSYELAFRNQFYTPRYVVEFLTANTLGRIWYEMRKGDTILKDQCRYLIRRPTEIFLGKGEETQTVASETHDDLSQETLLKQPIYVPYRAKKDPREIKVLDPACGSGHFLLYCFDLLLIIYKEAYDDPDLGTALRKDYPSLNDLLREMPGLILKNNLHGIDIDLRATQIAALALWLRCQKMYQELGLKNGERPKIKRSNIVCAEPMPGETDLLKEFTSKLQPKVLAQLVELVFEKMKLAGEAGSLLKIEEDIQSYVYKVKGEYIEWKKIQEEAKWALFADLATHQRVDLFEFTDITDESFLDRLEEEVIFSLRQYAEKAANGKKLRRRLFSDDAARGFGLLELSCHKYDAILMNPPFGGFTRSYKAQAREDYPKSYNDIFAAFTERWYWRLTDGGALGAITSRVGFFLTSFKKWRSEFLLPNHCLVTLADLGESVMDDAMVESAAYVLHRHPTERETIVIRLLGEQQRESKLLSAINQSVNGKVGNYVFIVDLEACASLPGAPIVYWIKSDIVRSLAVRPHFEPTIGKVRCGLSTGDNFRFVRLMWEVSPHELQKRWFPLVMAGTSQPWFSPILVVVDWLDDGKHLAEYEGSTIRSKEFYFKPGFSWTRRAVRFIPYIIPSGCIPSASRYQAYPSKGYEYTALGITASNLVSAILRFYGEKFAFPNFLVDNLKSLPCPKIPTSVAAQLRKLIFEQVALRRTAYQRYEPFHEFVAPSMVTQNENANSLTCDLSSFIGEKLEEEVATAYGFDSEQLLSITRDLREAVALSVVRPASDESDTSDQEDDNDEFELVIKENVRARYEALISYCIGTSFGRWDVRLATGERKPPQLTDPFGLLPICPPGMLLGSDGLPAEPEDIPSEYPVQIAWNGILVDDPEQQDDIVHRIREVFEIIWKDRAEATEKEVCEILGVRDIRNYIRKPSNGGFWNEHIKRYSKSRRKAPIYWYLRSSKGNYGLWIYYHRLDKDILFKALLNYVEPKIRLEEDRLKSMRGRKVTAGSSGESKQIEKEMDYQEQLISELYDFKEKLRRTANLHLEPDLNDGVLLNIAPLWELVPWGDATEYWNGLLEGNYDWSSISKQLSNKDMVSK